MVVYYELSLEGLTIDDCILVIVQGSCKKKDRITRYQKNGSQFLLIIFSKKNGKWERITLVNYTLLQNEEM